MVEGLWSNEAGRKISQILRKAGYRAAKFGKGRVSGYYPSETGYKIEHLSRWQEIEIHFEIGRFDKETNERAELEKIKALLEAQDLAIAVELKGYLDVIKVTYKDPLQVMKEQEK